MAEAAALNGFAAFRALAHLVADPLAATRKITDDHGDYTAITPSFSSRRKPFIHVVGADHAETVLKNHKVFQNGGIIMKGYRQSVHNTLRCGYFTANGREYEHYVRLFGPHFKKKVVGDVYPILSDVVLEHLGRWPTGETVDIVPCVNALMKDLASRGMFRDTDIVAGLHAADMVEQHGRLSGASIGSAISASYGRPAFSKLHKQAIATYDAIVDWGKTRQGLEATRDILSTIVNAPDENGRHATPDRIAGYGWTMLGASYDTSTSILSWLFVLLSTHPEVARKLHDEVAAYRDLGESDIEAIMALPYLDAVIKEALRLVPPAPIQRRKAAVATEIAGHHVRQNSQILISAWMTNRDEALYPDPNRYYPERWDGVSRSPYQWLTFSAGPRRCLGIWFAYAFLKTIVAGAMSRWHPDIPDGTDISMKVAVTVRPVGQVPVTLRKADGQFRASRLTGNAHSHLRLH